MKIDYADFDKLYRMVLNKYDEDTLVMYQKLGITHMDDIEFLSGNYDRLLFDFENPMTADDYEGLNLRELKKTLIAIKKGRIDHRNFKLKGDNCTILDLQGLCQQRKILFRLIKHMSEYNWKTSNFSSLSEEYSNVAKRDHIMLLISDLSQTAGGPNLVNHLWRKFSPQSYNPLIRHFQGSYGMPDTKLPLELTKKERKQLIGDRHDNKAPKKVLNNGDRHKDSFRRKR